jgi:hypothetical protein
MEHQISHVRVLLGGMLVLGALAVGSLALVGAQESALPAFALELTEDGLTVPETATAGLVAASFTNSTEEMPLAVILARLNEDVTMDDLMAAMMEGGPEGMIPLVSLLGGSDIAPGTAMDATLDLKAGQHIVLNFASEVPAILPFVVTEDPNAEVVEAPVADISVTLVDFAFGMPLEVEAGPQLWTIENKGTQWHETAIVKLAEGITPEDLMPILMERAQAGPPDGSEPEAETGTPPFEDVFFWMPMGIGERAWVTLDLEPGTYAALCFLPDFESGTSHLEHGMIQVFEVTEAE